MEKEIATHSSVLAWRIPGTGEPGGLLSMGSHRVGHDWCDLAAAVAAAVFIWGFPGSSADKEPACNAGDPSSIPGLGRSAGERHGNPFQYSWLENPHEQRSLAGYSPWGCKVRHDWVTKHTTSQCVYASPNLPIYPTLLSLSPGNHKLVFYIHDCTSVL